MVKKLKGKATKELKGIHKRSRDREYDDAAEFMMKWLPLIILILIILIAYFIYYINKR